MTATSFEWQVGAPEGQGVSSERLERARANLEARGTRGLLVVRRDQIMCEWYAPDWHAGRPHFSASLAKAIVGGMTLLVALGDGRVEADDPAATYVPRWAEDPLKSRITLRHMATHTSGIENAEQDGLPHEALPGWKGEFWRRSPEERDPFTIARDVAPVVFDPGARYAYSNPGIGMLGYCVTVAMRETPTPDLWSIMRERVFRPIGVDDSEWSLGYNTPYLHDGLKQYANWGGGMFTPRATARVARLLMAGGAWEGERVLDAARVRQVLTYAGMPLPDREADPASPASGLAWYTNEDGAWPGIPRDAFAGAGAQHQLLLAVPSLGLIVVRNGQVLEPVTWGAGFWSAALKHVFQPVVDALG